MHPLFYLRSLQNTVNFTLRSQFRWSPPLDSYDLHDIKTLQLQRELSEFLYLFDWDFPEQTNHPFAVADIGARDFSFAPVYEHFLKKQGITRPTIHGIEIDAYRRYRDLQTRADYGYLYAKSISDGHYHPCDFLEWRGNLDLAFLLHPFVTPEPPLRWGLPLSKFKPQEIFSHARELLLPRKGILIVSNPSPKEFEVAQDLAMRAGFRILAVKTWMPRSETLHQRPRLGMCLQS